MGIGSIASTSSMTNMQLTTTSSTDSKSKSIQNEIEDVQQQMQKLSSEEDLSVDEKANERKKLQKEITDLNTELKQHQEELRRSQRREIMMAELQEDRDLPEEEKSEDSTQTEALSADQTSEKNLSTGSQQTEHQDTVISRNSDGVVILKEGIAPAENPGVDPSQEQTAEAAEDTVEEETQTTENDVVADAGPSHREMHAMISADSSIQQANRQGAIVARTRDGIAILKGEMSLDEERGGNTEKKQAELEKMEQREERAQALQFSILGEANNAMKSAAEISATGMNAGAQVNPANGAINALNLSLEDVQTSQERFFVSIA